MCRADCRVTAVVKVVYMLEWMLRHSSGRHKLHAQDNLGVNFKYLQGKGGPQEHQICRPAFPSRRRSRLRAHANSQANLGSTCFLISLL